MSTVLLDDIRMKRESKSFTDAVHAVLTAAGLFDGPKHMLSGLSGMAFKFTVHERLLPLSVSAYGQWGTEHRPAIDNLGVFTIGDGGRVRHPTFRYYQRKAVQLVKSGLDRGVGAVCWLPEFGVIHGYDDEDGVFFAQDGIGDDSKIVLYDNFGLNVTPFWYCRTFGPKIEIGLPDAVLESLRLAVRDYDTPHKTLPDTAIASGKLAYAYLIRGLRQGDYDERGARYILRSYVQARTEIRDYLRDVRDTLPGLEEAAELYGDLVRTGAGLADRLPGGAAGTRADRASIGELCDGLAAAERLESLAIDRFRAISARYPDAKRSHVPRWGAHTPR
ncbi:hypothetical protein [Paenibacillus sp. GYB003]|uniref:hypothetical protein n=1 Tax=Paenibacillus sp. GYB003 TaxID=2994392 RepID=UPI002F967537